MIPKKSIRRSFTRLYIAWQAIRHGLTTPDTIPASGGHAGNRSLAPYMKYGYVPDEDGPTSNALEYAFDDWMAAQFAKALGKSDDYAYFQKRSENYRNTFDPATKHMRRKHRDGTFVADFDPFYFGCDGGWTGSGYMEGNAWLYTFYVPHEVPALVQRMGQDTFNERLEEGFRLNRVDMGNQAAIHLDKQYHGGKIFEIETLNSGPKNVYIQSATLNGKPLNQPFFEAQRINKRRKVGL